ncbi:hypothetical protein OJF2_09750 [Aquisphaera giovannonii]|uniref:Uncharacterized protein n=1 Tax=Aquisphaera giovannonii TaxID=406548 RepID=A0A5B9VW85_9BACT|nr:hypothetical protein [Aquisphaera giovannonii]QEH32498.1 hypothetical protein OJF2_09750 [Aquisphaera giovannonii]
MGSRSSGRKGQPGRIEAAPTLPEGAQGGMPDGGRTAAASLAGLPPASASPWPRWARIVASLAILYHMAAVVAGAVGVPPSSPLERRFADTFAAYHDLVDQGYAYRYYAEPPPTPVAAAVVRFGDGREDVTVRLPDRSLGWPLMRHQRQLALANALFNDVQGARRSGGEATLSRLGRAYARHLGHAYPGSRSVTLHVQQHLIPSPEHVRRSAAAPGGRGFDLFDEDLFTSPEWVGDYPCDGS